jgi:KDO2-lipid IV(A) lauroyltransferase
MTDRARPSARQIYLFYRTGAAVFRALPRPAASLAGALAGLIFARRSPLQRRVVAGNLRHVVGRELGEQELAALVRRAFVAYGRYWAEAARLRPHDRSLLRRRWTIEGAEHFRAAAALGRGVVLALPHLGTWEAGGVWAASVDLPLTAVAEPLSPPELFRWFVAGREALGIKIVPLGPGVAGELSAALRAGGAIALLSDRDLGGDGIDVEFFGERTRLPAGPAIFALRTGAALLPCAVYDLPGGRHHAIIRPPLPAERQGRLREDAQRITQTLAHELEKLISAHPEQWHVFQPNWPSVAAAVAD